MKIAIYGVSRSGKDHLITTLVDHLNRSQPSLAYHLKGSQTLDELARKRWNIGLKQCSEAQKAKLRQAFFEVLEHKASQHDVVLVDGHYAFPDTEGNYRVVFTEQDRSAYDVFFYLDTPSAKIVEYARASTGDKRNLSITEHQIRCWKEFERRQLAGICLQRKQDLQVLNGDTDRSVAFLKSFIDHWEERCWDPASIAEHLITQLPLAEYHQIALVDCDRTASEIDLSGRHAELCGITPSALKAIFRNDRYSAYQFEQMAQLYQQCGNTLRAEADRMLAPLPRLSHQVLEEVHAHGELLVVGITAGVRSVWQKVNEHHRTFDFIIGHDWDQRMYITPAVKYAVTLALQARGLRVHAYGDSIIDLPMLEAADSGCLVAHAKLNAPVARHLAMSAGSTLQQLNTPHQYPELTIRQSYPETI